MFLISCMTCSSPQLCLDMTGVFCLCVGENGLALGLVKTGEDRVVTVKLSWDESKLR